MANTNEYLVYGWSVQQLGNTVSQSGYAYPGTVPTVANVTSGTTQSQQSVGAPSPLPGNVTQLLINPGYADGQTLLGPVTAPALPTSGTGVLQNPYGLAALVSVACGASATVTQVQVAPETGGAAGTYTTVGLTLANSTSGTFTVPGAGFIKITYTGTPTWVWVTTN